MMGDRSLASSHCGAEALRHRQPPDSPPRQQSQQSVKHIPFCVACLRHYRRSNISLIRRFFSASASRSCRSFSFSRSSRRSIVALACWNALGQHAMDEQRAGRERHRLHGQALRGAAPPGPTRNGASRRCTAPPLLLVTAVAGIVRRTLAEPGSHPNICHKEKPAAAATAAHATAVTAAAPPLPPLLPS
jgi:hypothetical protein